MCLGHHIVDREDVPENIAPLCHVPCHVLNDKSFHDGNKADKVTHMKIYNASLIKRPDIARYMEKNIREWAKFADPELVDKLRK